MLGAHAIMENGTTRTVKPGFLGYDYATFTASQGEVEIVVPSPYAIALSAASQLVNMKTITSI